MNGNAQLQKIERKIQKIKERLLEIGEMRAGSISKQFNVCGKANCRCKDKKNPKKHGPYYQLSYVHKGKSTSQFIKKDFLDDTKRQTQNYKTFKKLVDEWIDLALQHAKLKLEIAKKQR
jgi:hypothetical protein